VSFQQRNELAPFHGLPIQAENYTLAHHRMKAELCIAAGCRRLCRLRVLAVRKRNLISRRQASDKVYYTVVRDGRFVPLGDGEWEAWAKP
jgi:hypothetical protein